jgi:hypothetical protein
MARSRGNVDKGPVAQLATRIPAELRRQLKTYCVELEVSMEDFIAEALAERLKRVSRQDAPPRRTRSSSRR